jgi:hypothetical protein
LIEKIFEENEISKENMNIFQNYKHPNMFHQLSNANMDIFIFDMNLAFEYQGEQHFQPIYFGNFNRQLERDEEKKKLCKENSITLICIPYSWSGLIDDLKSTIFHYFPNCQKYFPKIKGNEGKIIFEDYQLKYQTKKKGIQNKNYKNDFQEYEYEFMLPQK